MYFHAKPIVICLGTRSGFTVSIFITELAFVNEAQVEIAKISIFIASGLAAILGSLFLLKAKEIKQIVDDSIN